MFAKQRIKAFESFINKSYNDFWGQVVNSFKDFIKFHKSALYQIKLLNKI